MSSPCYWAFRTCRDSANSNGTGTKPQPWFVGEKKPDVHSCPFPIHNGGKRSPKVYSKQRQTQTPHFILRFWSPHFCGETISNLHLSFVSLWGWGRKGILSVRYAVTVMLGAMPLLWSKRQRMEYTWQCQRVASLKVNFSKRIKLQNFWTQHFKRGIYYEFFRKLYDGNSCETVGFHLCTISLEDFAHVRLPGIMVAKATHSQQHRSNYSWWRPQSGPTHILTLFL